MYIIKVREKGLACLVGANEGTEIIRKKDLSY